MKTYKKIVRNVEDKVYCDACGSSCTDMNFGSEYATLEAYWGYSSKSDGKKFNIQICEKCFYELIGWIKEKRISSGCRFDELREDPLEGSC